MTPVTSSNLRNHALLFMELRLLQATRVNINPAQNHLNPSNNLCGS